MPGRKHLVVRVEVSTSSDLLVQSGPGAASVLATNAETNNVAMLKAILCAYIVDSTLKTTPLLDKLLLPE